MLPFLLAPFCASAQDGSEGWRNSVYVYAVGAASGLGGIYQRYDLTEQGPIFGVSNFF